MGETYAGTDVLALVEKTKPDMLLLDLRMPGLDGFMPQRACPSAGRT